MSKIVSKVEVHPNPTVQAWRDACKRFAQNRIKRAQKDMSDVWVNATTVLGSLTEEDIQRLQAIVDNAKSVIETWEVFNVLEENHG